MRKRISSLFLIGISFFLCSCVDTAYDLINKEISTDIEFKENRLNYPLGSLRAFMLDSLIGKAEFIETNELGEYCITYSDTLSDEKRIDPIELKSTSIEMNAPFDIPFEKNSQMRSRGAIPSIPLSFETSVSFNSKINKQFECIYACSFEKEMLILLNLQLNGLEVLQPSSTNLNLNIEFPSFFKDLRCEDEDVKIIGSSVHITKQCQDKQGFLLELYCPGFDFEEGGNKGLVPEKASDGNTYLVLQSKIKANGEIQIECDETNLTLIDPNQQFVLNIGVELNQASVQFANGDFYQEFYKKTGFRELDLGDLATTIREANSIITLTDPYIEVIVGNAISIPIETIEFELHGKDIEDNVISGTEISTNIQTNPAQYDEETGEIITDTTKLLLTSSDNLQKDGFEKIETPNLQKWLEYAPNSVHYSVRPITNKANRANIRVDQALNIWSTFNAVIPLGFKEFQIAYSDTIPVEFNDPMEIFSNVGLKLKMDIANTVPLGVSLTMIALDENNSPMNDIIISPIEIDPCTENHCTLQNTNNKRTVEVGIKSKNNHRFSEMKHIKFNIEFYSKENTIILKNTQGIQLYNISIEVSGDIKTNLNE